MQLPKTFRPLHDFLKTHKTALALIAAFLLFRFLIISTSLDLFDYEECIRGTVALELMHGLRAPYIDYMWTAYDGAGLTLPFIIAPFFLLFGVSGFTLKLMMLLTFSLGAFLLIYVISLRYFGRKTALFAALLALLSPPFFTVRGLMPLHEFEDTFFTLLIMFLFFRIFYGGKTRARDFIALGITSGFALWFGGMTAGITITCLIFWLALDRGFFLRRNFAIFLGSFIAGFSPAIYYNLAAGMPLADDIRFMFVRHAAGRVMALGTKTITFLAVDLPASLSFKDFLSIKGWIFNYAYYIIFAFFLLFFALAYRRKIVLFLRSLFGKNRQGFKALAPVFPLAFLVVYSSGYLLSNFTVMPLERTKGYRYLLPLLPFMFIIIAHSAALLAEKWRGIAAFASACMLALLLCIGFASNAALIVPGNLNFGDDSIYIPYCYDWLAEKFGIEHGSSIPDAEKFCNGFDGQDRNWCYRGVGIRIGYIEIPSKCSGKAGDCNSMEQLQNAVEKCSRLSREEYRSQCYAGFVWRIATVHGNDIAEINILCRALDKVCSECCAQEIGFSVYDPAKNCAMLDERYKKNCYFHIGELSVSYLRLSGSCDNVPRQFYGACISGFAYGKASSPYMKPWEFAAKCQEFGQQYAGDCCRGVGRAIDETYANFPSKKATVYRLAGGEFAAACGKALNLAGYEGT